MKKAKRSQLKWPNSKHNKEPSLAVDVAPYFQSGDVHIFWDDRLTFTLFAGLVLGIAHTKGIKLRWGGDWQNMGVVSKNKFNDLVHFELMEE